MSRSELSNEILIPINNSTNANDSFCEKTLIQKNSYRKVQHIIENNLLTINGMNNKMTGRYHETITVLGERGSGKTSFLLNLQNILDTNLQNELSFLKILDPTLFENKQHVMLTVISIIINKVEDTKEKNDVDSQFEEQYKESLNSLADGINLLDGIDSETSHKSIWEDARINFNKGISSSRSGISFEEDFKKFISITLKYIKRKMFILIFDDIDTNIEKGWPVLEVIRKYLTTLELQVIVSGDWNLFSKLVRVNQFKNLNGLEKIEEECDCKNRYEYLKTLDTLEEQYLTKILKPENRVMLQNIQSINRSKDIYIIKDNKNINTYTNSEKDLLENIYKEMMYLLLNTKKEDNFDNLKKIFLILPLRSNIQLLAAFFKLRERGLKFRESFVDDIGKQFLTQLSRYQISYQDFSEFKEDTSIYYYIKKALEIIKHDNNIPFENFLTLSTLPVSEDEDKNMLFFILKSFMSSTIHEKSHLSIEWMFKIELYNILRLNDENQYENILGLNDDLTYLGFGKPTSSHDFIVRLNGYLLYQENEKKDKRITEIPGFIKVYKDKSKMGKVSYDYFISQVQKMENANVYGLLSYMMFNEVKMKRESQSDLFGSIYYVLGFISDLMKGKSQGKKLLEILKNKAFKTSIRTYSDNYIDSVVNYDLYLNETIFNECDFINEMDIWLEKINNLMPYPLETLNNTIKEFYYQEMDIPPMENFGDYLKLQTIYFLNALLKADLKNIKNEDINVSRIKNLNTAFNRLESNISNSGIDLNTNTNISLFAFIYSCPLWEYLIGLHSNSMIFTSKTNINKQSDNNLGSLFGFSEEEETDEEFEVKENEFFKLLQEIKAHKTSFSKEMSEIVEVDKENNEEVFETVHNIDKYLELFLKNKSVLEKYKVTSEDEISDEYIDKFRDAIKGSYKERTRFKEGRRKLLKDAIWKFSLIKEDNVHDNQE